MSKMIPQSVVYVVIGLLLTIIVVAFWLVKLDFL
jgi:hypothetical protein